MQRETRSDFGIKGKTKCLVCNFYDSGEIILFETFYCNDARFHRWKTLEQASSSF